MNSASFLAEFGHIANAPDGVERLRALVLQLAATGMLVVSDGTEGNADALISKLAEEKAQLIASGLIKRTDQVPPVDLSNPLLDVPTHWGWVRLGNLTSKIGSGSTPRGGSQVYVSKGVPFLRSQNVWNDGIHLDDVVHIDFETHQGMRNTQVVPNDILLNITGASLGRCASVPSDFPTANVSQHVTIIRPLLADIRHFIRICLLSPFGQQMIWGRQVGMAREGLSKKVLEQFEIPLPPLAEQKCIVVKVDELMALCDKLEAHQQERERRFPVLSRICHARFAEAPTPVNLNRIFDETGTLSTDDLRKTILALARLGRFTESSAECPSTPLGDVLAEPSSNGISKGPTSDKTATEILRISAGTSRSDFYVNEDDVKHVSLTQEEMESARLRAGDLLACRYNGNLSYVGRFSLYRGESSRIQVNPDKLIRFRVDLEKLLPRYVCYMMNAAPTREIIESMCATTAGNIGLRGCLKNN